MSYFLQPKRVKYRITLVIVGSLLEVTTSPTSPELTIYHHQDHLLLLLFSIKGYSSVKDLMLFFIVLIISIIVNWQFFDKPPMQINNNKIIIPGSWQPFILIIIIFSTKYFFGYMHAVNPELATKYKIIELIISSWTLGIMFFKAIYYYSYKTK
ncbi:hypothetical protein [Candidatus Tisiphia endosymbiont of Sialis lutaria]|uniref:hypothetical protein n=1 Tax=Candidatus Tisiphia endosymbiont of Sialis lutaria TaxID=2029164 RepID=UPI00312C838C